MRPLPLLGLLALGALACDDSAPSVAPDPAPEAFLAQLLDDLRGVAREHQALLGPAAPPLLPSDATCDPLVAGLRARLEPTLAPGVVRDWDELMVRTGLVALAYQLSLDGEPLLGPPRPFEDDGRGGVRLRVEFPAPDGDSVRQDWVLARVHEGWRLCRRPLSVERPEDEVALALELGLLPAAADAPAELVAALAAVATATAAPRVELLANEEDGASLRLELQVESPALDRPLRFTAVHGPGGWEAAP